MWKSLGSGLITGASDDDPSAIATYTIAGARFGNSMLWTLLFSLPFMIVFQEMSARIGALSGCGLAGNIKRHYPVWLLIIISSIIVATNTLNVGANIYGMAGALNLLLPIPIEALAIILSAVVLILSIVLRYDQITSIFKWLAITLFAYVFAFFAIHVNWGDVFTHTIIPSFISSKAFVITLFAVIGTTISPYLFFWQASEEAEDVRMGRPQIKVCKFRPINPREFHRIEWDVKAGMIFSNVISFFIMALTAATLFRAGVTNIETLREAAAALQPLAGEYAYLLFTAGIIGVGLLSIPVLAGSVGYVLSELMGWRGSLNKTFLQAKEFYLAIVLSVIVGLLIPFLGISPVQALFYTAVLNGLISPILIMMLLHMSSNPNIVGPHVTRRPSHIIGLIGFFLMLAGSAIVLIL
jgi:NRAMP (natural resistance-associated macrophage protein)-like metal ion transporter